MSDPVAQALAALGIVLPAAAAARGAYSRAAACGSQLLIAGQGPVRDGKPTCTGRLGEGCSLDEGRAAARLAMINVLAQASAATAGGLGGLRRCLAVTVYVSSGASFYDQAAVADAATAILESLWGVENLPVRTSVGVFALPANIPVMVDAVFEIAALPA